MTRLAIVSFAVALCATLVLSSWGSPVAASDVATFSGGPGSVTLNGMPAPAGTRIEVFVGERHTWAEGYARTLSQRDGSFTVSVRGSGSAHFTVDGFMVAGARYEVPAGGAEFANVTLHAGVGSDPSPAVLYLHGAPGSVTRNGFPVADGTTIEVWSGGRRLWELSYRHVFGWEAPIALPAGAIEFMVDGIPVKQPEITLDPAEAPYWLTLAVEAPVPVSDAPTAAMLWDELLQAVSADPTVTGGLDADPEDTHAFTGAGLPDGVVRATVPPGEAMTPNTGRLIASTPVLDGSWTLRIAPAQARLVVLEIGDGRDLRRTGTYRVRAMNATTVDASDFAYVRESWQILWGRGFIDGVVRLIRLDGAGVVRGTVSNGVWQITASGRGPEQFRLQFGTGSGSLTTDVMRRRLGSVVEIEPSDFTIRNWEPDSDGSDEDRESEETMESGSSQPSSIDVVIMARLRPGGRIEFGLRTPGAVEPVFPRLRFLPSDPPVGRWLRSTIVSVDGVPVGFIIARRTSSGRTEFGFRPDWEKLSDLFPRQRFFPANPEVDRWLHSSEINVDIAP